MTDARHDPDASMPADPAAPVVPAATGIGGDARPVLARLLARLAASEWARDAVSNPLGEDPTT